MTEATTQEPKINTDGVEGKPKGGEETPPEDKPKGGEQTPPKDKPGDSKPGGDQIPKERVVPEKYDLKLPEDSELDEGDVKNVADFAKQMKLTNDEAQKILDRENTLRVAMIEGQEELLDKQGETFLGEAKADSEIGGDNFDGKVEMAKRVIDAFGTDELKRSLNTTKLGNHKEVIRVFSKIGEHLKDDSIIFPKSETPKKAKSMEDVFYPDDPNKKKEQ